MGDRTYYRLALPSGLKLKTLRRVASAFTGDWWTKDEAAGASGRLLNPTARSGSTSRSGSAGSAGRQPRRS